MSKVKEFMEGLEEIWDEDTGKTILKKIRFCHLSKRRKFEK